MYRINHISINVKDLQQSIEFYEGVLGFERQNLVDMGDHYLQYFKINEETQLELIDYCETKDTFAGEQETKGIYRHFALEVEHLEKIRSRIKEKSCIKMEISCCEKLRFRNMLIVDPNGVEIEIIEKF